MGSWLNGLNCCLMCLTAALVAALASNSNNQHKRVGALLIDLQLKLWVLWIDFQRGSNSKGIADRDQGVTSVSLCQSFLNDVAPWKSQKRESTPSKRGPVIVPCRQSRVTAIEWDSMSSRSLWLCWHSWGWQTVTWHLSSDVTDSILRSFVSFHCVDDLTGRHIRL